MLLLIFPHSHQVINESTSCYDCYDDMDYICYEYLIFTFDMTD